MKEEAPDQFTSCRCPRSTATDEAFVGQYRVAEANPEVAQVLLEETLTTWRRSSRIPNFVVEERERLGLAEDLEPELEEQIVPYYEEAAEEGVVATDCGGEEAARTDFEFYGLSGRSRAIRRHGGRGLLGPRAFRGRARRTSRELS